MARNSTLAIVLGVAAISLGATAHAQRRPRADRLAQARPAVIQDAGAAAAATATISSVDVVVMAGSHGAGGIARELRAYPQLARPPFSAFSQIDLVSQRQLALTEATPATLPIPNNGTIRVAVGASRGRRSSVIVTITLGGRTHQSQYSVVPGDPFFLVHSTGVDSALIVRFVPR
ncbi:MAG: hypothetical protein JNK05_23965 [Myxococcales bacterium]|nr:hypothetical protein [Myxococcales bacterium]